MWLFDWLFGKRPPVDPDRAAPHRQRGADHLRNGDYAQAIAELSEAVTHAPDDPDLHNALTTCYRALGDETNADRHARLAQRSARRAARATVPSGPSQPAAPSRPKVIGGLEDGSPFVMIDNGNGMVMMMDRMAYEYMYVESNKPDPSQQALDGLLGRVARVKVWAGGMMRDNPTTQQLLAEVSEPGLIEAFRRCFRISEDPSTFNHCMCLVLL